MTALQPLTDRQVQNRLETYNQGGALERDIRALWHAAGPIIESEVRDQFGDDAGQIHCFLQAGQGEDRWYRRRPALYRSAASSPR